MDNIVLELCPRIHNMSHFDTKGICSKKIEDTGCHDLSPSPEKSTPSLYITHCSNQNHPSIVDQAEKLRQQIEKHLEENPHIAFEAQVEAAVAEYLIDSGLRAEYIDGTLIAKCMPLSASSTTSGKLLKQILEADFCLFHPPRLNQLQEESIPLNPRRNKNSKTPEGGIFIDAKRGKHERKITLVVEVGSRNSDERKLQDMLDHATMEYIRAKNVPNLYLFLKIFENLQSKDEWVACLGLFDLMGGSAKLLWCCEFSSAPVKSTAFLREHSKEIHDTLERNQRLQAEDYSFTNCENRWEEANWRVPLPQLYDWIWIECRQEFNVAVFEFPLGDVAEKLDNAIRYMHEVSVVEEEQDKNHPRIVHQAEKLRQQIEKHLKENPHIAFEAQVEAAVAEYLIDSGLRAEYIDGTLIAKCVPLPAQSTTSGELVTPIIMEDSRMFDSRHLFHMGEESIPLKPGRSKQSKTPEGGILVLGKNSQDEDKITLIVEIGSRNSAERTLQDMLDHATKEYIQAEDVPNLYLFLKIFENLQSKDEWIACLGLFDLMGGSAKLLWCCEFSSAPVKSTAFLRDHSKEIHDTLERNQHLQAEDYSFTSCENRWEEAKWSVPLPQLYGWIWEEHKENFNVAAFEFSLSHIAQILDRAIKRMHKRL